MNRMQPVQAAETLITEKFPQCSAVILAGSTTRGEGTTTSDLDIVIFDELLKASYRESFTFKGWPVEVFVHNLTSYEEFFRLDCERGIPSMPRMVDEGIVLKGAHVIEPIRQQARELLERGPEPWSKETIDTERYFITDLMDDLIGSDHRHEQLFILNTLTPRLVNFILRANGRWTGSSKWAYRSLMNYDPDIALAFSNALESFYQKGNSEAFIEFTNEVLSPHGGTMFDGFSLGKR